MSMIRDLKTPSFAGQDWFFPSTRLVVNPLASHLKVYVRGTFKSFSKWESKSFDEHTIRWFSWVDSDWQNYTWVFQTGQFDSINCPAVKRFLKILSDHEELIHVNVDSGFFQVKDKSSYIVFNKAPHNCGTAIIIITLDEHMLEDPNKVLQYASNQMKKIQKDIVEY